MSLGTDRTGSLQREGIRAARVWWNLSSAALYEESVRRSEGLIAVDGPLVCRTGPHTGRWLENRRCVDQNDFILVPECRQKFRKVPCKQSFCGTLNSRSAGQNGKPL